MMSKEEPKGETLVLLDFIDKNSTDDKLADSMIADLDPDREKWKRWDASLTEILIDLIDKNTVSKRIKWKSVLAQMPGITLEQAQSRFYYLQRKLKLKKKKQMFFNFIKMRNQMDPDKFQSILKFVIKQFSNK